ncbi:TolC family protein [Desulfogranum mediterraneum]|uniref:TolC family protein n=1 Tax=Desulfogranum mediterraneum TaxID=160661 RepID=UPI0003FA1EB7|nr:TolC family protein [Desulfogranum mediterraneum]
MRKATRWLSWWIGSTLVFFLAQPLLAAETSLPLNRAVELALANNPQVEIAREQCVQGQGGFTQAKSGYLPQVSAGGEYGRQWVKDLQPEDEGTVGHGSISLSQLIYDFGKTTGAIDAGRFRLQAADANFQQFIQDVVLDVRQAFYTVLEKRRLVDVALEAVANYEKHLYRARRYYQAGVRTKIDVTNAQVNLSNAKLDLLRAESNLKAARVDFEKVVGNRPHNGQYRLQADEAPLDQLAATKPVVSNSLDLLLATAFEHRADMRQVQLLGQASAAEVTTAKSGYFPSIDAKALYDTYDTDLATLKDQWNVSVGLTWELFSGFRTQGEVVEAKARYRELLASLNDLRLAVTQEVTERYLRGEENRQAVDLADESLGLAEENLELAEGRYKAGLNDMIEFNDAQLSLTQAQSTLVTTYYSYLTALARIERAVGVTSGLEVDQEQEVYCQALEWTGAEE